jgi:hypothetical protein
MQLRQSVPKAMMPHLLLALLLVVMLVLLVLLGTSGPQQSLRASKASRLADASRTSADSPAPTAAPETGRRVTARDTINGQAISDPVIVQRIERIAAALPAETLASIPQVAHVWYLAHGFGPGDDAPIFYGAFQAPAAALAFGCAIEGRAVGACSLSPVAPAASTYEDPPGVRCTPLRLAFGAPAYEPDRCESGG